MITKLVYSLVLFCFCTLAGADVQRGTVLADMWPIINAKPRAWGTPGIQFDSGNNYITVHLPGITVARGGTVVVSVSGVGFASFIDATISAASGTETTCSVLHLGGSATVRTETLTFGTPIGVSDTGTMKFVFTNHYAGSNTFTGTLRINGFYTTKLSSSVATPTVTGAQTAFSIPRGTSYTRIRSLVDAFFLEDVTPNSTNAARYVPAGVDFIYRYTGRVSTDTKKLKWSNATTGNRVEIDNFTGEVK